MLRTIRTQNWRSQSFWENYRLPESRPKRPKMTWFACSSVTTKRLLGLAHYFFIYIFLPWSWGTMSTQNWRSRIFWKNSWLCKNGPKKPKMVRLTCSPIIVAFLLRIRSLDLPHILHEIEKPQLLKTEIIACLKADQKTQNALICLFVHYGNIFPWDWFISFFWYFV